MILMSTLKLHSPLVNEVYSEYLPEVASSRNVLKLLPDSLVLLKVRRYIIELLLVHNVLLSLQFKLMAKR